MMQFQTPKYVCDYMAAFLPENAGRILEPTPGAGNLSNALQCKGEVIAPARFEDVAHGSRFDWVVMNPPFSPMVVGYYYLYRSFELSDNVVALLPWLSIINSEKRTSDIKSFGLKSITHLPRSAFKGARVQCCVLELIKGWKETTTFHAPKFPLNTSDTP